MTKTRRKVWFFRSAAAAWMLLAVPGVLWWPNSVLFVILMSLYANAMSSWASSEAADDRAVEARLAVVEAKLDALLERQTRR